MQRVNVLDTWMLLSAWCAVFQNRIASVLILAIRHAASTRGSVVVHAEPCFTRRFLVPLDVILALPALLALPAFSVALVESRGKGTRTLVLPLGHS